MDSNSKEFSGVTVYNIDNDGKLVDKYAGRKCQVVCSYDPAGLSVRVVPSPSTSPAAAPADNGDSRGFEFPLLAQTDSARMGALGQVVALGGEESLCFLFAGDADVKEFRALIDAVKGRRSLSVFSRRTEEASANQYFQFYGYLSQQQNMMQDFVRTSTYQKAIHSNLADFQDKVVLDVGAGSGILSFFAAQAGARLVYAVEASNMAQYAEQMVAANGLGEKIRVVAGKIEEVELPQQVDVIISEPMGYMLYNERMLETYLHARKWLRPGGKMYPTRGDLHVAPFTDEALYTEQFNKASFWYQNSFHGVDLSAMRLPAMKEYFQQPIVDTFDIRICSAKSVRHSVDFLAADETDLHQIDIPLEFHMLETGTCHGLAFWFDVAFIGSKQTVWLSTSPTEPLTHWYQVRCLLQTPIFAKQGQVLSGRVLLAANSRQSYDVTMDLHLEGTSISSSNTFDLKNPYFRYTGAVAAPPGNNTTSPSENVWLQLDAQGARNAINLVNGISLGDASMDLGGGAAAAGHPMMNATNLIGLNAVVGGGGASGTPPPPSNQPNIHPGCILSTSTGRMSSGNGGGGGAAVFLNSAVMQPQNLTANGGGPQQGFLVQQQQQPQYMTNGGGVVNNSNSLKFSNGGSLQQQPQTYMHHN